LKLKFQTVAEKTAKNFRGLLYFATLGIIGQLGGKLKTLITRFYEKINVNGN